MSEQTDNNGNYIVVDSNGMICFENGVVNWIVPARNKKQSAEVTFSSPSGSWGTVTHYIMPWGIFPAHYTFPALRRALILAGVLFVLLMLGG
jgi:hypothetical protein